ncbi:MAG: site-specific integrase [Bacteroidales bacterium]|nr:site-specific integrase [Bacteroidales bacterium]
MKATKIEIGGEFRIMVQIPNNKEMVSLIRQVYDAKWSYHLGAWHIPYTGKAFRQLQTMFPEIEYPNKQHGDRPGTPEPVQPVSGGPSSEVQNKDVVIQVIGRKIIIKLPKNKLDIHFIRSLRYSRWDVNQYFWVIPNYPGNLELINDYFNNRIKEIIIHAEYVINTGRETQRAIKINELLIIKTTTGRLKLIFGFNKELTYLVKKMPFHQWDARNKWWTIPYSEKFLHDIKSMAESQGMEMQYEEEETRESDKAKRVSRHDISNYRNCPKEFINKLKELRYSDKTIKTYSSLFEEFINYYHTYEIQQIDEKMILAFLQYLVIERKVSTSYQNQSINAIKFHYERVMGGSRKVYMVDRPRREKKLPIVLNEAEISKTIKMVSNLKHKAIIMITYSGGLRLGEVINLKIKDIDSNRMQIFVRQAKGQKDRYTLLSKKALEVLRAYIKEYKPREWLFEGINGRQYSDGSVYMIVKAAFRRAGIKKKASPHTLRHCFATHLLENGTDLRYIQSLMGHESSKTTEIYTHVTTKGFDQIENPLDKLEL